MPPLRSRSASFHYLTCLHKLALSTLLLLGIAITCLAGTFLAFGPKNYTRPSGSPVVVTDTFSVLNPATQYTLKAFNGGMQNDLTELVAQTVVTLNGVQIINSANFNSSVAELDIAVSLQATNTLTVELRGKPGGVLTIEVIGVDNDPPTIKAAISPLPNAAGWNNTSVTVTFTCNDATSGVASCPAPQTVTTEGSSAISGTATDNGGNTASTSTTVNIDKTVPTMTASASPLANSNNWNNSDVTVTFLCADSLSGVANCTSPVTVSTEGANQMVSGTAIDNAGNAAPASATINLDKTPPTISITSPVAGATFTASSVSVTGNVSDSLSGISSVTCNGASATIQSGTFTCSVSLAFGSNTITAQATDLAGNPASAAANVFRNSPPSIASLSPTSGPVGTPVTLAGSYFGNTQGASTIAFNGALASPSTWSDTQIQVPVPSGASTGNVIVTVSGLASNGLSFTVLTAPVINSLSPTSGPVGTSVIISGINFGATQGSSTMTFNGISATATSWSDTQISVTVPSGAITGPVVVTVAGQTSGGGSGPIFAVGTPPTIAATVSPAPNANGWINSNAVVTFTCTAGSSPIATCPAAQTITSEGANQPVSGTATDTDGTTATKTVYVNIDKTPPMLAITSPSDGSAASSAMQPVTGSVSDASSGVSSVTCNGTAAPLSSGSFSCNISLNVGVNLLMVRATDAAGNIAASYIHVDLAGTLPAPQTLQITPATANVPVSGTQGFSVVDQTGHPRPDAVWTVSDATIATITADSSPVLTGVAVGQVTLTATAQSVSTQIQVNIVGGGGGSVPPGTVLWSAPAIPGFNTTQIIQAEPVENGPDLYSLATNPNTRDVVIRAVTDDGKQMWSHTFPGTEASAIADGNGGILVSFHSPNGNFTPIVDLDAQTGGTLWENDSVYLQGQQSDLAALEAVAPNGTILVAGLALDAKTGAATKLQPANTPQGVLKYIDPCGGPAHTAPSPYTTAGSEDGRGASVAADGTIFQVVSTLDFNFLSGCQSFPASISLKMYLSQTAPDGSATFTLFDTESSLVPDSWPYVRPVYVPDPQCYACTTAGYIPPHQNLPGNVFFQVVPDGQGGAFVPWWRDLGNFPNYQAHLSHVSGSAVTDVVFPLNYQNTAFQNSNACPLPYFRPGLPCTSDFRVVLGENGGGFATDLQSVVAFDTASMAPLWTHSSAAGMDIVAATADGGVTVNDFQLGLFPLDANGNAHPISGGQPALLFSYSWSGSWFSVPSAGGSGVSALALPVAPDPANLWATPQGNPSQNGFAAPLDPSSFQSTDAQAANSTCPICNLQPPNCLTMQGLQPSYLILVGDQGLNAGPGHNHNLGDLLNLSAQQKANDLNQQGLGNWVVACRVSSIQDFNAALTEVAQGEFFPSQITGGVFYFGHAAYLPDVTGKLHAVLAPGEGTGQDTNVGDFNITTLQNIQLGPNATVTLNGCNAGAKTPDYNLPSIAQLLALQLQRTVFAYDVGIYFSHQDVDHDSHFNGLDLVNGHEVVRKVTWGLPMYALPEGVPGHKPRARKFASR